MLPGSSNRFRFKSSPFGSLILGVNPCDSTGFTQERYVYTAVILGPSGVVFLNHINERCLFVVVL